MNWKTTSSLKFVWLSSYLFLKQANNHCPNDPSCLSVSISHDIEYMTVNENSWWQAFCISRKVIFHTVFCLTEHLVVSFGRRTIQIIKRKNWLNNLHFLKMILISTILVYMHPWPLDGRLHWFAAYNFHITLILDYIRKNLVST